MARTVYTEKRGEPVLKKLLQVINRFRHTTATYKIIFTLELKQYFGTICKLGLKRFILLIYISKYYSNVKCYAKVKVP